MFTGIVEEQGKVVAATPSPSGSRLVFMVGEIAKDLAVGDSLSVDGVCLTVVEVRKTKVAVDCSEETLRRSTLRFKRTGSRCNLERPLRLGARLGGHLVTGHVDGVGEVSEVRREGNGLWVTIDAPVEVMRYVVHKGSVAVDGISLTVAAMTDSSFSVAVIPHTATVTTLGAIKVGTAVNLEADIIGKYVERFVETRFGGDESGSSSLSKEFLAQHGFS